MPHLNTWDQVAEACEWNALLIGNGLSINVWKKFTYESLYDEAAKGTGLLAGDDLQLFGHLGTENFEVVLHAVMTAGRVAQALGRPVNELAERYASIQAALGHAVKTVHPHLSHVPEDARATIKDTLKEFSTVFTTNYDLLLYWAMGYPDGFFPLMDCLIGGGFDPNNCDPWPPKIPVYFLHGALHLVVRTDGSVQKIVKNANENVLDQFALPYEGDIGSRPLLITEGRSSDKVQAIEGNIYLRHVWEELRNCRDPLVVFGSALAADQDAHVVDAINLHPSRPVAVGVRPGERAKKAMKDVRHALETETLYFFDSTTHPLGTAGWQAESERLASFSVTP